jgi:hypothetical protein
LSDLLLFVAWAKFRLQTSVGPNSKAIVGLWRRFFELKEKEEEERLEVISSALEDDVFGGIWKDPINSEHAIAARREMVCGHYRQVLGRNCISTMTSSVVTTTSPPMVQAVDRNQSSTFLPSLPGTRNEDPMDFLHLAQ